MAGQTTKTRRKGGKKAGLIVLLLLPYLGLCFPVLYARSTPSLGGFPFFYWYQFMWVVLESALLAVVYLKIKD